MGLSLKSFTEPFSDPFDFESIIEPLKAIPDPGVHAGIKLHESLFGPGATGAPSADPEDLVTPFRRPLQERLVTNLFLGAGGPTQALSELARSRLLAQRGGIPAASTGISATARARLVGSTGKSAADIEREKLLKEREAVRKAAAASAPPDIFGEGGGQR